MPYDPSPVTLSYLLDAPASVPSRRTNRITDATPLADSMKQGRYRGVRCICWLEIRHLTSASTIHIGDPTQRLPSGRFQR